MSLRDDVLVQRDAIGAIDLELVIQHVRQAEMTDSLVSNFEEPQDAAATEWVVNRNIRDTQEVHLPAVILEKLGDIHRSNIANVINPFYAIAVRDSEPAQILHYGAGGHYIPHVDAETLYTDEIGLEMWEKTLDRDLSVVYFLNDDFAGGELVFPKLDLTITPTAGSMVCFPSDHNFIHGVNPVKSGRRYTLVTWMRIEGMPTPEEINQLAMDEYNRIWPQQIEQRPRVAKGGLHRRDTLRSD
jgi:Rps23 Pro-64 3,4-dihydroxylase Tpa1-like proline 4-hydroxylase